jgi:hypothetical protein
MLAAVCCIREPALIGAAMYIYMEKFQYLNKNVSAWGVTLQLERHATSGVYHVSNALDAVFQRASRYFVADACPVVCCMYQGGLLITPNKTLPDAAQSILFTASTARELYESLRPYLTLLVRG